MGSSETAASPSRKWDPARAARVRRVEEFALLHWYWASTTEEGTKKNGNPTTKADKPERKGMVVVVGRRRWRRKEKKKKKTIGLPNSSLLFFWKGEPPPSSSRGFSRFPEGNDRHSHVDAVVAPVVHLLANALLPVVGSPPLARVLLIASFFRCFRLPTRGKKDC